MKQVWVNLAVCSRTRSVTRGALLPTETTAMPEPKSMSELPSASTSTPPPAAVMNTGRMLLTPRATARSRRASSSREAGPGISVTRRRCWGSAGPPVAGGFMVIDLTIRHRPPARQPGIRRRRQAGRRAIGRPVGVPSAHPAWHDFAYGYPRPRHQPAAPDPLGHLWADSGQRGGAAAHAGHAARHLLLRGRRLPAAGVRRPVRGDTARADHRPAAAAGADRPGGGHRAGASLRDRPAGLLQEPAAVGADRDVRTRRVAAPARQHALPADLRQQRRGPLPQDPVPDLLPGGRVRRGLRFRGRQLQLAPAAGRGVRRDRRCARGVHRALPPGPGLEPGPVPVLHPVAHPGLARARALVRAAVGVRDRPLQPGRGGLRCASVRLRVRLAGRPGGARGQHRAAAAAAAGPVAVMGVAEPGLFDGVFARGGAGAGDQAWLTAMLQTEAALARALERAGLAPDGAGAAVTEAARAGAIDAAELGRQAALTGNPVPALARALAASVPPAAAAAVHKGATSQDIIDTAAMLLARSALEAAAADMSAAADAVAALAARHRDTVMIGRTLLQQAVPVTFGLVTAGWLTGLDEARAGLDRVRAGRLAVQFGGAGGTLASLGADGPRVAALLAAELGLPLPVLPWHTDRLRIVEVAAAGAGAAAVLGKIARDVTLLAQSEVAEVREGEPEVAAVREGKPEAAEVRGGDEPGAGARRGG